MLRQENTIRARHALVRAYDHVVAGAERCELFDIRRLNERQIDRKDDHRRNERAAAVSKGFVESSRRRIERVRTQRFSKAQRIVAVANDGRAMKAGKVSRHREHAAKKALIETEPLGIG